jgi:hypothetical protein
MGMALADSLRAGDDAFFTGFCTTLTLPIFAGGSIALTHNYVNDSGKAHTAAAVTGVAAGLWLGKKWAGSIDIPDPAEYATGLTPDARERFLRGYESRAKTRKYRLFTMGAIYGTPMLFLVCYTIIRSVGPGPQG